MKRILYLSFYFEPDLCAGSFRNSPLVKELAKQAEGKAYIDVLTTLPNRYSTFDISAEKFEERENYSVHRIEIPKHQSGMKDQVFSFKTYYTEVKKLIRGKKYDLVVASSSRLFTAFLGYRVAKKLNIPLYLDIRDIFVDTLEDVLQDGLIKKLSLPVIRNIEKRTFSYAKHINLISEGFKSYFNSYNQASYSYFPNGIDDVFIEHGLKFKDVKSAEAADIKTIVYAGNLGEGQGLEKIVPAAALALGNTYQFLIIGDGGAKQKLISKIEELGVQNVTLKPPVKRDELLNLYQNADFLFVHLNDYKAFEKVLPSKFFELSTFNKPIIAGVGGYAHDFVKNNLENAILFKPCDVDGFVNGIKGYDYKQIYREGFINKFKRDEVNKCMAQSMLNLLG